MLYMMQKWFKWREWAKDQTGIASRLIFFNLKKELHKVLSGISRLWFSELSE